MDSIILGIESSCDDTAAAVIKNNKILANVVAGQEVHVSYGGVVPELASRSHLENIIPVVDEALKKAKIKKEDLSAVAFTKGPGLIGPLMVGAMFAKSFALGLDIPIVEVHHIHAHMLAHFLQSDDEDSNNPVNCPGFPFICLTVSGGHTLIAQLNDYLNLEVLGETLDDAAGEAFDKTAKILGFNYPGGPLIDQYAVKGNEDTFPFPEPVVPDYNFSFSGLKTSILYFIRDNLKKNPQFIEENKHDICASVQKRIVSILMNKLIKVVNDTGIKEVAIAGGVSANSGLRKELTKRGKELGWNVYIPKLAFCTDNAAMIAITGYYKYLNNDFANQDSVPDARYKLL